MGLAMVPIAGSARPGWRVTGGNPPRASIKRLSDFSAKLFRGGDDDQMCASAWKSPRKSRGNDQMCTCVEIATELKRNCA
jgi:hypothetical protein